MEIFTLIFHSLCLYLPFESQIQCSLLHIAREIQFFNKSNNSNETSKASVSALQRCECQQFIKVSLHFLFFFLSGKKFFGRILTSVWYITVYVNCVFGKHSALACLLISFFQFHFRADTFPILKDCDDIESADVLSGQYHAWVAFVRCIYFKPDLKPDLSYLMFGI